MSSMWKPTTSQINSKTMCGLHKPQNQGRPNRANVQPEEETTRQWHESPQADEHQLVLQEEVRYKETPDESLTTDARRIWAMHLGMARKAGSTRPLSLGARASRRILLQKRKAAIDLLSRASVAKEWLAQRSVAMKDLSTQPQRRPRSRQSWTEAHEAENYDERAWGRSEHALLWSKAQQFAQTEQRRQHERELEHRKVTRVVQPPHEPFHGMGSVYLQMKVPKPPPPSSVVGGDP